MTPTCPHCLQDAPDGACEECAPMIFDEEMSVEQARRLKARYFGEDAPLIGGGQSRFARDVVESAIIVMVVGVIGGLAVVGACAVWWMIGGGR